MCSVCAIMSLKVLFRPVVVEQFTIKLICFTHTHTHINFTYVKFKRHVSNNFSGVTRDRMKIAWVSKSGLNKCDIFYTVFVFVA